MGRGRGKKREQGVRGTNLHVPLRAGRKITASSHHPSHPPTLILLHFLFTFIHKAFTFYIREEFNVPVITASIYCSVNIFFLFGGWRAATVCSSSASRADSRHLALAGM